jgi:amidase
MLNRLVSKLLCNQKLKAASILLFSFLFIGCSQEDAYINHSDHSSGESITSIHKKLLAGGMDCQSLIEGYLDRIAYYDLNVEFGAPLNALVTINPSVRDYAKWLDDYYQQHNQLIGPLHCIPVVIKDNIDTYDMPTSAGTLALMSSQPQEDAVIVKKLRDAGAIILAKTTMDEFASFWHGVSSRSGRTGNAYDTNKIAGGSSGGSAVAIAADFAIIGIGTDNSGSLHIPSVLNGLNTLRVSTGIISQTGLVPRGNLDGMAGPMTRSIEDLAIVMDIIAKEDNEDSKTHSLPRINNYQSFLNNNGLEGKRIGVVESAVGENIFEITDVEYQNIYNDTFAQLENLGAKVIYNIQLPDYNIDRQYNGAGGYEAMNQYLSSFPGLYQSYEDLCHSEKIIIFEDKNDCLDFIYNIPDKDSEEYQHVLDVFSENRDYIYQIMNEYNLDALIYPIDIHSEDTVSISHIYTTLSSNSGLPSIMLIVGYTEDGMPVGLQLLGKQFDEGGLIEMAYAYEQSSHEKIFPKLKGNHPAEEIPLNIAIANNLRIRIGYDTYQ